MIGKGIDKNESDVEFNFCVNNVIKHNVVNSDDGNIYIEINDYLSFYCIDERPNLKYYLREWISLEKESKY